MIGLIRQLTRKTSSQPSQQPRLRSAWVAGHCRGLTLLFPAAGGAPPRRQRGQRNSA